MLPMPDVKQVLLAGLAGLANEALRAGAKAASHAYDSILEDIEGAADSVAKAAHRKRGRVAKKRRPLEQPYVDTDE
jgi:F420-dependent methylenetetrahydromethanopterin dehydrogenase